MSIILHLTKKYIRGTTKKTIVQIVEVLLCHLTTTVVKGASLVSSKIYLNTRVLKHLYDKRTAEEFDFMSENLIKVVKYPDKIYKNKSGKRGSLVFTKVISNSICAVSLEVVENKENTQVHFNVVTFFRTDEEYLSNYELLWEWKGGKPSS